MDKIKKTSPTPAKSNNFARNFLIGLLGVAAYFAIQYFFTNQSNQAKFNQTSTKFDQLSESISQKNEQLFNLKNKDAKTLLPAVQSLQSDYVQMQTLLGGLNKTPETSADFAMTGKAIEALKAIEKGILDNNKTLKDKGFLLLDSLLAPVTPSPKN